MEWTPSVARAASIAALASWIPSDKISLALGRTALYWTRCCSWASCSRRSCSSCRCRSCSASCCGKKMLETVMLTSVTRRPTRLSTLLATLRRTASASWGIDLPYSAVSVRSMAASSWPTSTETPWVWLLPALPPVMVSRTPPTDCEALPPILMPSTSWEAIPAIFETTLSEMLVEPRSVCSGLPCLDLFSLMFLLSSVCVLLYRPACYQPVDRQQDYRAKGRNEDRPEAYSRHFRASEEALDNEAADECSRYADQDSDYDPTGIRPWHNPLGQHAGYEPDHYQRYDAYALSPPPRAPLTPIGGHPQAQYNRCRTSRYYCPFYPPLCTHKPLRRAGPAARATRRPGRRARRPRRAAGGPRRPCRGRV